MNKYFALKDFSNKLFEFRKFENFVATQNDENSGEKFEIIPDEDTLDQFVDLVKSIGLHIIFIRTFDVDNVDNHIVWRIHFQLFLFFFGDPFWIFARKRFVIPNFNIIPGAFTLGRF